MESQAPEGGLCGSEDGGAHGESPLNEEGSAVEAAGLAELARFVVRWVSR